MRAAVLRLRCTQLATHRPRRNLRNPRLRRWQLGFLQKECASLFADMSIPCCGIGRYLRPIDSSSRFCQFCLGRSLGLTSRGSRNGPKEKMRVTSPFISAMFGVKVFAAPGNAKVGEGQALQRDARLSLDYNLRRVQLRCFRLNDHGSLRP